MTLEMVNVDLCNNCVTLCSTPGMLMQCIEVAASISSCQSCSSVPWLAGSYVKAFSHGPYTLFSHWNPGNLSEPYTHVESVQEPQNFLDNPSNIIAFEESFYQQSSPFALQAVTGEPG